MSFAELVSGNWRDPLVTGGTGKIFGGDSSATWQSHNGHAHTGGNDTSYKAPARLGNRAVRPTSNLNYKADAGEDGEHNTYVKGSGQAEKGWMNTLQQTTGSNKGASGTPTFSEEVYSTRETRANAPGAGDWTTSFRALPQHADTPLLDPSYAQMYGEVDKLKGAVRRSTARLL